MEKSNLDVMVDKIAEALLGDSRVTIEKYAMKVALEHDLNANGNRPLSEEDIEFLVTGEDLDGTSELERLYPNVCEELTYYF